MNLTKAINTYPKPNGTNADERLTVSSASVQLTSSSWDARTHYIVLDVQDNDVMCTFDGSTPTSSNGHRLYAGQSYTWSRLAAQSAKFIRQGSSDGVVHASQFTD